jgi:hypothetical protein
MIIAQSHGQVLQRRTYKNCSWPRTEQHLLLFTVITGLISILYMSVSIGQK